mgnify:CR=1 FL=1|jgi:hypothetical protein
MKSLLRTEWINDPELKRWSDVSCVERNNCSCNTTDHQIELCEHDTCIRGQIDTIICTECNVIVNFDIIR